MTKTKLKDGRFMVRFARESIESHYTGVGPRVPKGMKNLLRKDAGVFVTLKAYHGKKLRGEMGYLTGIMPLSRSLPEVAESAAFRDHRFHPLRKSELKTTVVEVSLLSKPKLIEANPDDSVGTIKIGKHGLIVKGETSKSILLPRVAVERGWGPMEFLSRTCMKAHLKPYSWKDKGVEVYVFTAETFAEEEPGGKISRVTVKR